MTDESKPICLLSFPNKFAGAEQVACDLGCGTLCYEHPENIARVRASKGWVICVFCALKMKREHGIDLDLQDRQLWHGAARKMEIAGDVNQLVVDLLKGKN